MKIGLVVFAVMAIVMVAGMAAEEPAGTIELRPQIGWQYTTHSGDDVSPRWAFVGGIEAEYYLKPQWGVTGGVFYSAQGARDESFLLCTNYITVPLMVNFHFGPGFAIHTGIQPSFRVKSYSNDFYGRSVNCNPYTNLFDIAFPMGLSYEYRFLYADLRYRQGIIKVFNSSAETIAGSHSSNRNMAISLTIGYRFKIK